MKNWVKEILGRYNLEQEFADQQVLVLWHEIVGEQLAKVTQAKRLSKGILTVETASNTVSQELSFLALHYVELLNKRMGRQVVIKIRFVPGNFIQEKVAKTSDRGTDFPTEEISLREVDDPHLRVLFTSYIKLSESVNKRC